LWVWGVCCFSFLRCLAFVFLIIVALSSCCQVCVLVRCRPRFRGGVCCRLRGRRRARGLGLYELPSPSASCLFVPLNPVESHRGRARADEIYRAVCRRRRGCPSAFSRINLKQHTRGQPSVPCCPLPVPLPLPLTLPWRPLSCLPAGGVSRQLGCVCVCVVVLEQLKCFSLTPEGRLWCLVDGGSRERY
jgi:hypothetical protein